MGFGGKGKSALVNHWLAKMGEKNYEDAERIFGWTFFSQGAREIHTAADPFIISALKWFGDPDPSYGTAWDKGERLAKLIRKQKTILILDGIEPHQFLTPGIDEGKLKDESLRSLITNLVLSNNGLCIITSRFQLTDIASFRNSLAPVIELPNLSPNTSIKLLRSLGVKKGTDEELKNVAKKIDYHALALKLMGSYLNIVFDGEINRYQEVLFFDKQIDNASHAEKIMGAYEKLFADKPELDILYLLGLFNRITSKVETHSLLSAPAIKNLTENLKKLNFREFKKTLARLRETQLLSPVNELSPESIDAHPLVREYFGNRLKEKFPEAWKQGHNAIYQFLKNSSSYDIDSFEKMVLLYDAVVHGCYAGEFEDVFNNLYLPRIFQKNKFFLMDIYGAVGCEIESLSCFFTNKWNKIVDSLSDTNKIILFDLISYRLRTIGGFFEAIEPALIAKELYIKNRNFSEAAKVLRSLINIYLYVGHFDKALENAKESVKYADLSEDLSQSVINRTRLGHVYHQLGKLCDAENSFIEAENLLKTSRADYGKFLVGGGDVPPENSTIEKLVISPIM